MSILREINSLLEKQLTNLRSLMENLVAKRLYYIEENILIVVYSNDVIHIS